MIIAVTRDFRVKNNESDRLMEKEWTLLDFTEYEFNPSRAF